MKNLNYNHLYYFWVVARCGSITRATDELSLAQSTISTQIQTLETQLGERLFERSGRTLTLTEAGSVALRYCQQLFGLSEEMFELIEGKAKGRTECLRVGVSDTVPKLLAHRILSPLLRQSPQIKITVSESAAEKLLADLAIHVVDAVILDCPIPPSIYIKAYNHLLDESGISFLATPSMAKVYKRGFPLSLNDAPMLLPTHAAAVRSNLDKWFEYRNISCRIVAEFQDSALMKVFGKNGAGIFPVPTIIEKDVCLDMGCKLVGRISDKIEKLYLITTERRSKNKLLMSIHT